MAIQELERLRQTGASSIVFVSPTFWWLDYYVEFHNYLRQNYSCSFQKDSLIIFSLC
jgi:hypothetical protein